MLRLWPDGPLSRQGNQRIVWGNAPNAEPSYNPYYSAPAGAQLNSGGTLTGGSAPGYNMIPLTGRGSFGSGKPDLS